MLNTQYKKILYLFNHKPKSEPTSAVSRPSIVIQISRSLCLKPKPFFEEPNKSSLVPVRHGLYYSHISTKIIKLYITQDLKLYVAANHCMYFNTGKKTLYFCST